MPKDRVFLIAGILFLTGSAIAGLNLSFLYWLTAAVIICSVFALLRKASLILLALLLFSLIFGNFYYHLFFNLKAAHEYLPQSGSFTGIIVDEPGKTEKTQQIIIYLQSPYSGKIRVVVGPVPEYHYGDQISVSGKVTPAAGQSQLAEALFPKVELLSEHNGWWLKEKLINIKNGFLAQFPKFLPQQESALMSGILLGDKSGFDSTLKSQMSAAGVTHIVALSGYNVTIIVILISQIFGQFFSRKKTFYLTIIFIALFVLMCGAGASLVRAAIMGFLALLAGQIGRVYAKGNSLVFTALVMVLLNPSVLIYDAGFQLSFLSLLGIFYLLPALEKLFRVDDRQRGQAFYEFKLNALTTLSAQLAVMPLTVLIFGNFSLLAIFPNILILELMPLTMLLGAILGFLGFISYYLGFFLGELAHVVLAYELFVIKFFAVIQIPAPSALGSTAASVIYYAILIFFVWVFEFRPKNVKQYAK